MKMRSKKEIMKDIESQDVERRDGILEEILVDIRDRLDKLVKVLRLKK